MQLFWESSDSFFQDGVTHVSDNTSDNKKCFDIHVAENQHK